MTYRNLVELHRRQAERLGSRPALRYPQSGRYRDLSWEEYHARALACAAALVEAGIRPGDRVGLVAENRLEWLLADMGIMAAGAVNVPPHAPLTARQVHFQLADAGVRWAIVSTREQLEKIRYIREDLPALEGVVVFDESAAAPDAVAWAEFVRTGEQALGRLRAELRQREAALGPDDLATIMYTSGTTGDPKGVMLTHHNLLSNSLAINEASPRREGTVLLNWLPLSHIFARTADHYGSLAGENVLALAESADTLLANLAAVQPTHMASVPRFYEKVLGAVASPDVELSRKKLRAIFGPRIVALSSGGAALPPAVAHAYQAAGLLILQGYGLTETSPVITFNREDHYKLETVGQAIPGVEVAIAADGEILTRGPHVMKGYWNNPEATAEALREGWLYTGDLGQLDADGFLTITGRKKELLVLSNGKKVVPTFIEGLLLADPCIDQVVVHGEGRHFLTALIVPRWERLRPALQAEGVPVNSDGAEALANHPAVRELLCQHIQIALGHVAPWEQVKKFIVLPNAFTVTAGELTVSLKLRRKVILDKYKPELEALYRE